MPDPDEHAIRRLARVWSPQLQNRRDLDVYLPPGYRQTRRRYPVIYMQDGQNLADPARAFAGTWNLHHAIGELAAREIEAIIVGVPNVGEHRLREYSPFHDSRLGGGGGDAYVAFLERTVKPLVDRRFRTIRDRRATGVFGSSMGGLISLYAFFRAPQTFGLAGAMSPSIWFGGRALLDFVEPSAAPEGRIYVDVGSGEGEATLRDAHDLAALLRRKGYADGRSLQFVEDEDGRHEEAHWARRLVPALEFLLRG